MKTINASSTGAEFIQDLNDNFAECQTGASASDSISTKVPLQGGDLKSSTGYVDGKWCSNTPLSIGDTLPTFTWTDDNFYKYFHTPNYLSLVGNVLKSVTKPTGTTMTIFCYDEEFAKVDAVSAVSSIPSGTKYVKIQIYQSSDFTQLQYVTIETAAVPQWVKNTATPLVPQFFNYECKPQKLFDDASCETPHDSPTGSSADTDSTRYHNNGFVILPPTYRQTGEKTKFIIFFCGDLTYWFIGHDPYTTYNSSTNKVIASQYENNLKYLCNQGYAVVSLGCYTSMWSGEPGATNPMIWFSKIRPSYISALSGFYDYLMSNYNFDYRPYLAAKSAGGYMLLHTSAICPFPIRAAAGFSIGIELCSTIMFQRKQQQKSWQKTMGCPDWDDFVLNVSTSTVRANKNGTGDAKNDGDILWANRTLYRKLDPLCVGSEISDDDFDAYVNALFTDTNALETYKDKIHKRQNIPLKLWCATEDTAVSYSAHEHLVDIITRCGGKAELRSYTGNDGDHATFCGEGGKTANPTTPYGGSMTGVNIGLIEAVDWFKRW